MNLTVNYLCKNGLLLELLQVCRHGEWVLQKPARDMDRTILPQRRLLRSQDDVQFARESIDSSGESN